MIGNCDELLGELNRKQHLSIYKHPSQQKLKTGKQKKELDIKT
jgi:hypothetical protein